LLLTAWTSRWLDLDALLDDAEPTRATPPPVNFATPLLPPDLPRLQSEARSHRSCRDPANSRDA